MNITIAELREIIMGLPVGWIITGKAILMAIAIIAALIIVSKLIKIAYKI